MSLPEIKSFSKLLLLSILAGTFLGCTASMLYEKMDYWDKKKYDEIQYIATKQEKRTYLELHKSQRAAFLKDFWRRRDPTPDTLVNEFKIEHYRRLAYANKYFGTGNYPGWKTDRGWFYIKYGPPDKIDRNPGGTISQGSGGWLSPPSETWFYDYADGLEMNTQVYFADRFFTGNYEQVNSVAALQSNPLGKQPPSGGKIQNFDSDMGGGGSIADTLQTMIERTGVYYDFMQQRYTSLVQRRFIDEIEDKSKTAKKEQALPEIHLYVSTNKFLADKGFLFLQFDYQVPYTDLIFLDMPDGKYRATLYIGTELQKRGRSYMVGQVQKDIYLDTYEETINPHGYYAYSTGAIVRPGKYVLRVSLRDPTSGRVAYYSETITVNPFSDDFDISSVELASEIAEIEPDAEEPFRKYDWRVHPNPVSTYLAGSTLALYYEVYNLSLNENNRAEYITEYTIYPVENPKETVYYEKLYSRGPEGEIHGIQAYTLELEEEKFPQGDYKIEIRVTDLITEKTVMIAKEFTVKIGM